MYFFLCISVFLPWSGYCAINSEQHAGTMAHILLLLLPLYFVFSHCLVVSLKADQGNYRWEPGTKIQFTDTALEKKSWPTQQISIWNTDISGSLVNGNTLCECIVHSIHIKSTTYSYLPVPFNPFHLLCLMCCYTLCNCCVVTEHMNNSAWRRQMLPRRRQCESKRGTTFQYCTCCPLHMLPKRR